MKIIPEAWVINFHHYLLLHGRYTCKAKKPDCAHCSIFSICDYPAKKLTKFYFTVNGIDPLAFRTLAIACPQLKRYPFS